MPGLNTFFKRRRQRLYSSKIMAEDEEEECLRPQTPSSDGGSLPDWPIQRTIAPAPRYFDHAESYEGDQRRSGEEGRRLKKKQTSRRRWSFTGAPRRYLGSLVRRS